MKKIQKKLVLKKKTIAQLNDHAINYKKLKQVQGGKTYNCESGYIYTCYKTELCGATVFKCE